MRPDVAGSDREVLLAVVECCAADPRLVVVAEESVGRALRPTLQRRVLVVDVAAAADVAAGLVTAGRPVIVVCTGAALALPAALPGQVLVAEDPAVAASLWGQGFDVAQPTWPMDVLPLLRWGLAQDRPVVLRAPSADEPEEALPALGGPGPRILRHGERGVLLASGRSVPAMARAARMLTGRGVPTGAVQLPVLPGAGDLGPRRSDAVALLLPDVGTAEVAAADPADLAELLADAVALPADSARALLHRVLTQLPAP